MGVGSAVGAAVGVVVAAAAVPGWPVAAGAVADVPVAHPATTTANKRLARSDPPVGLDDDVR
jgi:hypothetical protein